MQFEGQHSQEKPNPHAEARVRVEADVAAAVQESFETNAEYIQTLEDGTEHLTLFVEPRPSVIAQVDVDRDPVDDQGNRTTIMKLAPIAKGRKGMKIGNGQVHTNIWRLVESSNKPPLFETGKLDTDGSFVPYDDELMMDDETVASFGGYWPANLRQGGPESPIRKSRGVGRAMGRVVLKKSLPPLEHKRYYS